jgi:peptidyl-prolyl cis-trans isomerase SurA
MKLNISNNLRRFRPALFALMIFLPLVARMARSEVIEEIVAQVNDKVIVLSEYRRSLEGLRAELQQSGLSGLELEARYKEQSANVLRELIDHQLLVQKAADLNLNADTEVVKRLDEIRQNMKLESMEALEEAVAKQGMVYEDFKSNMRDNILSQWVIQREVGQRVQIKPDEIKAYFEAHKDEFRRPEGVVLAQILVSTEEKKEDELPALRKKAEEALEKARKGGNFADLARDYSDDASASRGGEIGFIEKGSMSSDLETVVDKMNKGDVSDIITTRYGYMILQLLDRSTGGEPQLSEVESRVHEKLYLERVQPALRDYLAQLRNQTYIQVKSGYVDTGAAPPAVAAVKTQ